MTRIPASPMAVYEDALARREAELRELVSSAEHATPLVYDGEISDFKDLAALDAQSEVAEARMSQASRELAQVLAARARIHTGKFGVCQDCGDAIGQARLLAMPEALYCTPCQSAHERSGH